MGATDLKRISAAIHDEYFDVDDIEWDQRAEVVRIRWATGLPDRVIVKRSPP